MLHRRIAAWAIAFAGLSVVHADAQALPPVEAFGSLPNTSPPLLSPDAKHFALIQPVSGRPAAVIYETVSTGARPALIGGGDNIVAEVSWAKNDRVIIVAKQSFVDKHERDAKLHTWARSFSIDLSGTNTVLMLENLPSLRNNIQSIDVVDVNLDDPDHVLMGFWQYKPHIQEDYNTRLRGQEDSDFTYDVIKTDVHTGKGTLLRAGHSNTAQWIADGHGNPIVQVDQMEDPLRDRVFVSRHGTWDEFGTFEASGDKGSGIVGVTEDGANLVRFMRNDQSYLGLAGRSIAKEGPDTPLFFVQDRDVADPILDEWTGRVIGARYIADKLESRYFDPKRQSVQNALEQAFPGKTVRIVSWDRAMNTVTFSVESPRSPAVYYLLDRTTHQTRLISSTYPGLNESDLGEMKPYNYAARDGLPIPAYITLPPGKQPRNLPVVVMPHGGPDARDYIHFDWLAQFLANRGYVVLQPNFRGSYGYGHKFTEAGLQQWGLKIQDDVTDGVRKLIADGIADPKRVCIVGASFGGYVALAGAAFTPDLYACAASFAGVSDLPVILHSTVIKAGSGSKPLSFWLSRIGGDDLSKLAAASPSRNAAKVKCPVLLMHGEGDTTVGIDQSEIMNDALLKAGKKVEFVRFSGEDHYMNIADTRIRVLKELEKFLNENIGK